LWAFNGFSQFHQTTAELNNDLRKLSPKIMALYFVSVSMEESEEFLDQIHCQLSASGMHMEKEALKDYLLVPGEERLTLIRWALSELNIIVNKRGNAFFSILTNSFLLHQRRFISCFFKL
jgi:hypothetical protein